MHHLRSEGLDRRDVLPGAPVVLVLVDLPGGVEDEKAELRVQLMEEKRGTLLQQKVENERKEADSKAYALNAVLTPIKGMDWRTLMSVSAGRLDPKMTIAMAFRDLAENAAKIGELNISPDLLGTLLKPDHEPKR